MCTSTAVAAAGAAAIAAASCCSRCLLASPVHARLLQPSWSSAVSCWCASWLRQQQVERLAQQSSSTRSSFQVRANLHHQHRTVATQQQEAQDC